MANLKTTIDNSGVTSESVGTDDGTIEFKVKRTGNVQSQVTRVSSSVGSYDVSQNPFVVFNTGGTEVTASLPNITTNTLGTEVWVLRGDGTNTDTIVVTGSQDLVWQSGGNRSKPDLLLSGAYDSAHMVAASSSLDGYHWFVLNSEWQGGPSSS